MQYIPNPFAKENGLAGRKCDMVLEDEKGNSMTVQLRSASLKHGLHTFHNYLIYHWPPFHKAYGYKTGDVLIFELIHNQQIPLMKFYGT